MRWKRNHIIVVMVIILCLDAELNPNYIFL